MVLEHLVIQCLLLHCKEVDVYLPVPACPQARGKQEFKAHDPLDYALFLS